MLNKKYVYIYSLEDFITGEIRYIGKTANIKQRYNYHIREAKDRKSITKKSNWIKSLLDKGSLPTINIIDEVLEGEWEFWERYYISLYKSWGFNLTNSTEGGDGNMCWQKEHKKETKIKISQAHKGKTLTKEHKSKLSVAHSNPVLEINVITSEQTEYNSMLEVVKKYQIGFDTLRNLIDNQQEYNNKKFRFMQPIKRVYYPKERKSGIRIGEEIVQINKEFKVVNIWPNALSILKDLYNSSGKDSGGLHKACRGVKIQLYKGYYWRYKKDLFENIKPGDLVTNLNFTVKSKNIYVYNNNKLFKQFESIKECATFFNTSPTTINNYIKSEELYKNQYIFRNTKLGDIVDNLPLKNISELSLLENISISYRDVILPKEYFLCKTEKELDKMLIPLLIFVRKISPRFPEYKSNETLENVIKNIRNSINENIKDNIFSNSISNAGISFLKEHFPNYFHSHYKKGKSPVELWEEDLTMFNVIKYRIGYNTKRETFDFSLHYLVRGLSALRSTISFFKPTVAANIYKYFLKDKINPIVIDPCAGFGGRLLGFSCIYPKGTYIGIEPNIETYNNLLKLKEILEIIFPEITIKLYNCKLEDYSESKECDLTFTSIPYFDLENYAGLDFNYKNIEEWKDTFGEALLTYNNLLINLPIDLQDKVLQYSVKEIYYLKNHTSHLNKSKENKLEYILKLY